MADDIVVGSVAVDIVPDTRNFRRDLNAKIQGLEADVSVKADTTGVRAQIENASKSRPANIRVKVDDAEAKTQLAGLQNTLKDKTLALDLSTAEAKAKVAALQAQVAEVKGNTDLDTDEAKRRIAELQAQIKTLRASIEADTAPARAEIGRLRADIAAQKIAIKAQADTALAEAQLDETARDRTTTIRANVDKSQVGAIGKLSSGLGGISGFAATIITLGPALIPILAAVAGVGLALAAPLAIAGGGATVFGFLAGFAVKDTTKQLKDIDKLQAKLGTLKKGTKDYAATQADLKAKQDALSPSQKKFADALDHIKATFANLLGGNVGQQLLNPVSAFLNLTADTLPKLAPIITAVSGALTDLLGDLGKAVKGPDFKAFITAFSQQVGPDIVAFGHIAGNVFKGVAGLVIALGDAFGPGLLKGIENLTGKFAALGDQGAHSQKLQDFVDYFHRVGPGVASTLGAVARGVGHIVQALAPLGPPALKVIEGIADAISAIPIPVLTALAASFVAMTAAAKVGKGLSALGLLGGGGLGGGKGGVLTSFISKARPVPVFVTNQGFGAGGGKIPGILEKGAPAVVAGLSASDIAGMAGLFGAGVAAQTVLLHKEITSAQNLAKSMSPGIFGHGGGDTPFNPNGPHIDFGKLAADANGFLTSTTGKFDALKAHAQDASRSIDQIGPHAVNSFSQASKVVTGFNSDLAAIHDKKIHILVDDLAAVRSLEALQAYRLKNKTLTINIEQELERAVGPGGGRGRPTGSGGSGGGATRADAPRIATSPRTATSSTSPIHVDKMFLTDTNDVLRKADRQVRNRAGGGVTFPPPLVSSFAGAR